MPVYNMSLDEVNSILYGERSKSVLLRVDRNGEKVKVKFNLEGEI
jgi:hypothetical protein